MNNILNYALRYNKKFNWALVPAFPVSKSPFATKGSDWSDNTMRDEAEIMDFYSKHPQHNLGFELGENGLCSLDIDDLGMFDMILDFFGIDKEELNNYPTIQGSNAGKRIIFKAPSEPIDYHKITWPNEKDPLGIQHKELIAQAVSFESNGELDAAWEKRREADEIAKVTVFEIRAGQKSKRFDVLPPSIHPDTQMPYVWLVQPSATMDEWPTPPEWLLSIWRAWESFKPQIMQACPWAPKEEPKATYKPVSTQVNEGGNVIEEFSRAITIQEALSKYGYKKIGSGDRWLSPHSKTKLPGVHVFDSEKCWIHHASDPLCSDDSGQPVNSFDLFCEYEHNGDITKAVKEAAEMLGMGYPKSARELRVASLEVAENPVAEVLEVGEVEEVSVSSGLFRALGFNGDKYYYLPVCTEQVVELSRGKHTSPAELMGLAPLEWWESMYPKGGKSGGVDWQLAGSDCMRLCERVGIYSHELERGRGAWFDDGVSVMHSGDALLVNGKAFSIGEFNSKYIYERSLPMAINNGTVVAGDDVSRDMLSVIQELSWQNPMHGILFAGFCATAPICGALPWRSHIWLTAQRGAGKSWVLENIAKPIIGPIGLIAQGATTEAGLRQAIGNDARPIVFDEAEGEDYSAQKRMQNIIELARQSSAEGSAKIYKGTVSGEGTSFTIRCSFLLSSINVTLNQAADESRFSVVGLARNTNNEWFSEYAKRAISVLSIANCTAFRNRIFNMIPTIRNNAMAFSEAVAIEVGSRRAGDQIGTLLAGWYAMKSTSQISVAEAVEIIKGMDFTDTEEADSVKDEERCFNEIMQHSIRVKTDIGDVGDLTLGELVEVAANRENIYGLTCNMANDMLARNGLKVIEGRLFVANTHSSLKSILRDTPWGGGWRRVLARLEGSEVSQKTVKLAGSVCRGLFVPL